MPRKRRGTISAAGEVGGCLWMVGSAHSDHYVLAKDIDSAIATYLAIPSVAAATSADASATTVKEVRWVSNCVFGLPYELSQGQS